MLFKDIFQTKETSFKQALCQEHRGFVVRAGFLWVSLFSISCACEIEKSINGTNPTNKTLIMNVSYESALTDLVEILILSRLGIQVWKIQVYILLNSWFLKWAKYIVRYFMVICGTLSNCRHYFTLKKPHFTHWYMISGKLPVYAYNVFSIGYFNFAGRHLVLFS